MQSYKFFVLGMNPQNPHLPHMATEIESQPPRDALSDEMAFDSADRLIRELMIAQPAESRVLA